MYCSQLLCRVDPCSDICSCDESCLDYAMDVYILSYHDDIAIYTDDITSERKSD